MIKPPLEKSQSIQPKQEKQPGPADYQPNYEFLLQKGSNGRKFARVERFGAETKNKRDEKSDLASIGKYYIEEKGLGPYYR